MRKLTKTSLVFALSIVAMFSCVISFMLNNKTVKAVEPIEVTTVTEATDIANTEFELANVQVRIKGQDATQNGIKFIADAKNVALSDVVYGMIIIPTDNVKAELNEENLFGDEAKYTFDKASESEELPFAIRVEMSAEQVAELGGYMNVSLINFAGENITKNLTAVAYLKALDAEGKLDYDVKNSVKTSMYDEAIDALSSGASNANKVTLLDAYVGEADEDAYLDVAGYYTNAYKFDYNEETKEAVVSETLVNTYNATSGINEVNKGTYKLYKNGTMVITYGNEIVFGEYGKVVDNVDGLALTKVEIDTLRNALGGGVVGDTKAYGYKDSQVIYNGSSTQQLIFSNFYDVQTGTQGTYNFTYNGSLLGSSFKFMWDLIPISENFGLVYTKQTNSLSTTNFTHWTNRTMGIIYYTYNPTNGYMNLRYSGETGDVRFGAQVPYSHFVDMPWVTHYVKEIEDYPWVNPNGHFKTETVFNKLSDGFFGGNYVATNGATLVLGAMEGVATMNGGSVSNVDVMGGRLTLDDNGNKVNGTYSLVASVADGSEGLFFADMSETTSLYKAAEDKTRFAQGTYAINGNAITVAFTYNGVAYTFNYVAPAEVDASVYEAVAGNYTDTYVFNADKTVTRRDLNNYTSSSGKYSSNTVNFIDNGGYKPVSGKGGARYWYKTATFTHSGYNLTETGSYKLLNNGLIQITFGNDVVGGTYDVNGKITVDEKEYTKVDMETLYNDLTKVTAGYKDANSYSSTALVFTKTVGTNYFGDGWYKGQGGAQNWSFDYNIIPITENFGKIEAFMTNGQTGHQGPTYGVSLGNGIYQGADGNTFTEDEAPLTENISLYDFGKSVAEIYYAYENGTFRLSVSSGVSTSRGLRPTYNHFTDYTADKALVNGEALYTSLAKTYSDGTNTLVLSGLTDLKSGVVVGDAVTSGFKGGYGTFGANTITYSLIKLNANSGKIFFDMTATPQSYTGRTDKSTFCQGDYVIDGSNITITFTYAGTAYTVTYTA